MNPFVPHPAPQPQQTGWAHVPMVAEPAAWDYLTLTATPRDAEGRAFVLAVGGEADTRFERGRTPVEEALRVLGEDGWELAAVEPPGPDFRAVTYVLKRPR